MDELLSVISDAAQSSNWPLLAVASAVGLLFLVQFVLKAFGKDVSLLSKLVDLGKGLLKVFPKKAPPAPKADEATGVEAVVKVEAEKK